MYFLVRRYLPKVFHNAADDSDVRAMQDASRGNRGAKPEESGLGCWFSALGIQCFGFGNAAE